MAVFVGDAINQICDNNGDPLSGAQIFVYDATTTTPKSLFSDPGLSVGVANPIVCDSAGRYAMTYFATGTYKVIVKTSGGATLFTRDNIDAGIPLGSGALAIANGGTGATTAGAARTNLDVPSNATVTAIASDVATLQSSISAISGIPQGRLTPSTGTPVISSDVSASTNVYYSPYIGSQIPIWNGSAFVLTTFTELTLALVANHLASTFYDCFVINDSGTIRLVTGPAWNTLTAGAGARGSGAGTTELTRQGGLLVNANTMTARYGATTTTVAAKCGSYVGSLFIDSAAGQVTCHFNYGQSRKFGVWNAYNRVPIIMKAGDSTANWTYASATYRASNGASANSISVFTGLAEEMFTAEFGTKNNTNALMAIGIGWNSTTATSGYFAANSQPSASSLSSGLARYINSPALGVQVITCLESATSGSQSFLGTEANMLLTAQYRG